MTTEILGFHEFQQVYPDARLMSDGGVACIFIPELKFVSGQETVTMKALLCPEAHSGYQTRLFLEAPIPAKCQNWTTHTILNQTWHTWSWNNIAAGQPLLAMLANHLRALQ